ncbi:MAG: DUF4340 domain-containing protein [Deltaproteobacteria bacterium]|nr:DUF4340 domain-containing protein [Deltaproteobacteria bacterium]
MRGGPLVHGALLVAALALAYQTWTRDRSAVPALRTVEVWKGASSDLKSLALDGELRDVVVERREEGGEKFLWGTVTRSSPPAPKPAQGPDAGPHAGMSSVDEPPPKTTVRQFAVGDDGTELFKKFTPLRALRDLGVLVEQQKADFGLAEAKDKLTVHYASGPRELIIGGSVYGGGDRYVLEPESKRVYVLPGDAIRSLENADSSLRERKLHGFAATDPGKVVIKTSAKERALVRTGGEPSAVPGVPARGSWADAATPDKADQTLANFMDRVDQMTPIEYSPEVTPEGLTPVVRLDYQSKAGAALGWLELFKKPGEDAGKFDYYLRSERTRVMAKVFRGVAERVDQDLAQVVSP